MPDDLLDFIVDQRSKIGLADWAQQNYGQSDPQFAQLAKADPGTFRSLLPNYLQTQRQGAAIGTVFGGDQSTNAQPQQGQTPTPQFTEGDNGDVAPNAAVPQSLPTTDNGGSLAAYAPSSPPMATAPQGNILAKLAAVSNLPSALQGIAAQQIMMGGFGGQNSGGSGVDKIASAIADYHAAPLTGVQLKTPMGMAIQEKILNANPDYDANVYKQRTKTAQDMTPGGVMGQKLSAAQTAINHLSSMMDAGTQLGGIDAGFASKPVNALVNYFKNQDPNLITYNRFANMSGDEIAKFVAGSGGSTEADRRGQEDSLSVNNSPPARHAAAQAAVQAVFGKLEPIANQYNQAYGTNKTPVDFLSPETKASLAKLGMLPEGADASASSLALPSGGSALAAISAQPQQDNSSVQSAPLPALRTTSVGASLQDAARAELARRKAARAK